MMAKASRSGNPAKRATADRGVSSTSDFKKDSGGILELPSGKRVKVKKTGVLQGFIAAGTIPNPLMRIITESIEHGTAPKMEEIIDPEHGMDVEVMNSMLTLTDRVVCSVMVQPKVSWPPEDDEERDDDILYVDEMDSNDKMFLFQWASGGTSNLETFRLESSAGVDALAGRAGVLGKTQ